MVSLNSETVVKRQITDAAFREAASRVLSPALITAVEAEAENLNVQQKGAGEPRQPRDKSLCIWCQRRLNIAGECDCRKPPSMASQVREVFAAWVVATGKNAATKLDSNRENLIAKSIKSHGLETTLDAVRGVALSDFHMGRDPRSEGKKYNGLDLVLRNAEKIEHFAGLSQMERRNVAASEHVVDLDDKHAALIQEFIDAVHSVPGGWRSLPHYECEDVGGLPVQYAVKVKDTWVYSFADVALDYASIMSSATVYSERFAVDEAARQMAESSVTSAFESLRAAHARSVKMGRAA